jgi:fructokinase
MAAFFALVTRGDAPKAEKPAHPVRTLRQRRSARKALAFNPDDRIHRVSTAVYVGIETGGTKILARIVDAHGHARAEGRWPTSTPQRALEDLLSFIENGRPAGGSLAGLGIAAFGPVVCDEHAADYGRVVNTPKPGWSGSNLRAALAERLNLPVALDTDVNAAARAEWQMGAGRGVRSLAYVTVGTGIGAGLLVEGRPLRGALHPEVGHIRLARRAGDTVRGVCPFHESCVEALVSGPALALRLGTGHSLAEHPQVLDLAAEYLGELAATLVYAWSPQRIVWGGGVMDSAGLLERVRASLDRALAGYGVAEAVRAEDFCVKAALAHAGLEGALLMAGAPPPAV